MEYEVVVSAKARELLLSHAKFLAQVSIKVGMELFDQFEKLIFSLREMPERCPPYSATSMLPTKYRHALLQKHYLIIFQIVGNIVHIELILDGRAENTKHILELNGR